MSNDEDDKKAFGRCVRKFRQAKGWSQEHFAAEVGLDRTYVGSLERGERNVGLKNICKLARTLGVNPKDLFDWADK